MLPKTITLETKRLLLLEVTPESKAYILSNYSDEEIMQHLGLNSDEELQAEKKKLSKGLTNYTTTFKYFLLRDKENNNTIGSCGLFRWYPDHNRAEIGYSMTDTTYREKGLMKEAVAAIVQYAFDHMDIHRMEAFAGPENTPSVKILEGLGFKYEGLLREHYLRNGIYEDSACYSLLKHEFYK